MTDRELLDRWYHYAARADGFLGGALRTQRMKAFLSEEQQRTMLGILDGNYDQLWLRLQAFPLPRPDLCASDLARIVAQVQTESGIVATTLDLEHLEAIIRAGLRMDR